MNTNLKVILAVVGMAALAAPSTASARHLDTAAGITNAHGSVVGAPAAPVVHDNPFNIDDAVHVTFPQQSGGN